MEHGATSALSSQFSHQTYLAIDLCGVVSLALAKHTAANALIADLGS